MSEQDNVFPYGKFDATKTSRPEDKILAVLNGVQQNLMMVVQKIEILEHRINELENDNVE